MLVAILSLMLMVKIYGLKMGVFKLLFFQWGVGQLWLLHEEALHLM
jgi:hypothetical protein